MSNRLSGYSSSGEVAEFEVHGTFRQLDSPTLSRRNSEELSSDNEKEYDFEKT